MSTAQGLFKAQKKTSTVDMVINSVRDLLVTKRLLPGQRIPSENEICDGLGVSRGSVREAMKILSAFGVVEIKVGDGTYIPTEPKPAIINPLLFSFLLQDPNLDEVTQFRRLLEVDVVELIIHNKDRNQREREMLEENLRHYQALSAGRAGLDELLEADLEFHRIMSRASCNRLIQRIYDFAFEYLGPSIKETKQFDDMTITIHSKILESIRKNDLDLARKAVDFAIDYWHSRQPEGR